MEVLEARGPASARSGDVRANCRHSRQPTNVPAAPPARHAGDLPSCPHRFSISAATVVMLVLLAAEHRLALFQRGREALRRSALDLRRRCCAAPRARWRPCITPTCPTSTASSAAARRRRADAGPRRSRPGSTRSRPIGTTIASSSRSTTVWTTPSRNRPASVLHDYQAELRAWAADNKDALATHVHEWRRKETTRATPAGRAAVSEASESPKNKLALAGEANGWQAELTGLERDYEDALEDAVGERDQRHAAPRRPRSTWSTSR